MRCLNESCYCQSSQARLNANANTADQAICDIDDDRHNNRHHHVVVVVGEILASRVDDEALWNSTCLRSQQSRESPTTGRPA